MEGMSSDKQKIQRILAGSDHCDTTIRTALFSVSIELNKRRCRATTALRVREAVSLSEAFFLWFPAIWRPEHVVLFVKDVFCRFVFLKKHKPRFK